MERDGTFYRTYLLERLDLYETGSINKAQLLWELEQCEPYVQLDAEAANSYEDARCVLEELYAFSLEPDATKTAQDAELITEQVRLLKALLART